jgi:hypothetical protein
MNSQTKQFLAFFVAAGITAGILTWLSVSPRKLSEPSGPQGIPHVPAHLEMSSVSKSLSEMLPSIYGVPMGDVVVVPKGDGWRVVVFGVANDAKKEVITKVTSDFSSKNPDVGGLEVVFDTPPQ